ncbi:hypothetical protein TSUD_411310 [Trifolium subterraneum]|uniref:Uncharacterized protein n=1 Tax=Trifolium subterraneum TaxID=3900 RepID=A0A2Z6P3D4_TRISU|nr:hypothetical protein TSUD_411310 [Trifolium subterraneum]
MANLLNYDPSAHFTRAFSEYPFVSSSHIEVKTSVRFNLRSCFDTSNGNGDVNSKRGFLKGKTKGLEKGISVIDGKCDATIVENRSPGGSHNKPFCDHQFPQKLVVAVDVDEVLGNFVSALNRFIAERYSSNYSVSEYHVYEFFKLGGLEFAVPLHKVLGFQLRNAGRKSDVGKISDKIWNCSREEANTRVHEFFETPYFKSGIHPIPGAQMALQKLSRFCDLSVVTSRQNAIKDHTIEWIENNFSGLFDGIHFGNHFALDGASRPKSEICRSLNAKVLIDDNPRYAIECAEAGIRVLLFDYENSYPWSKTELAYQHPLVHKVENWEEVEQELILLTDNIHTVMSNISSAVGENGMLMAGAIVVVVEEARKYLISGDYTTAAVSATNIIIDQDVCITWEGPSDPVYNDHTSLLPQYAAIIADVVDVMTTIFSFLDGTYR